MADRVTHGGGYVGEQLNASERVTQAGGYVGFLSAAFGTRATHGGGYVGVRLLRPPCDTTEAQCWRIERTDGVVYRFTSHDVALPFLDGVFSPCGSLSASTLQTSAEFGETENMDLSGIISDSLITLSDLWAGRFDGASVEVYRVDWSDPTKYEMLAAGKCGSLDFGSLEFKFEVTTASERLQQRPILQPVMATCRYKLGEARCGVDLPSLAVTGAVTTVPAVNVQTGGRKRVFADASRMEADTYFQLGRLTWLTGDNAGISVDVKVFTASQFILEFPMQHDIQTGDTYSVTPGCDRVFETCGDKFANAINFGGFPHLRGTDDLQKTPGYKA